jgi:hypothetical protein
MNDPVLRIRLSDIIMRDNYGVHGSDYFYCRLCERESGAGVLNKGIPHKDWCPVARYEARVAKRASNGGRKVYATHPGLPDKGKEVTP